jgi:triacylglycerol lipase
MTPQRSLGHTLRAAAATAAFGFAATTACAQIGPDPTSASLNATAGPFDVSTSSVVWPRGFAVG